MRLPSASRDRGLLPVVGDFGDVPGVSLHVVLHILVTPVRKGDVILPFRVVAVAFFLVAEVIPEVVLDLVLEAVLGRFLEEEEEEGYEGKG